MPNWTRGEEGDRRYPVKGEYKGGGAVTTLDFDRLVKHTLGHFSDEVTPNPVFLIGSEGEIVGLTVGITRAWKPVPVLPKDGSPGWTRFTLGEMDIKAEAHVRWFEGTSEEQRAAIQELVLVVEPERLNILRVEVITWAVHGCPKKYGT